MKKGYKSIVYADVITLLAPSKTVLQILIDNGSEFLAEINLCINAEKIKLYCVQIWKVKGA